MTATYKPRFAFQVARPPSERKAQILRVLCRDAEKAWTLDEIRAADADLPQSKRLYKLVTEMGAEGTLHCAMGVDRHGRVLLASLQPIPGERIDRRETAAAPVPETPPPAATAPAAAEPRKRRQKLSPERRWARLMRRWVEGVPAAARRSGAAVLEARERKESAA